MPNLLRSLTADSPPRVFAQKNATLIKRKIFLNTTTADINQAVICFPLR